MVGIIKLFKNITSMVNVQEFRQRFISTTILSFLFVFLILLGNPYISIFFSILFSFVFFEYEKLNSKIFQKLQVFKIFFLQVFFLFFTIFEIYKIEMVSLIFNNITFLFVAVFFNIIFIFFQKSNFINFILSNLIIVSFFSLIAILHFANGLYTILYAVILVSTMDIFAYLGGKLFGKKK